MQQKPYKMLARPAGALRRGTEVGHIKRQTVVQITADGRLTPAFRAA